MLKNFPQADAEVEFVVMDYNSNTEDGDGDSSEMLDPEMSIESSMEVQLTDIHVLQFHDKVTRVGRARKKSRKQLDAKIDQALSCNKSVVVF